MPLPKISGVQNAGVDPNAVQQRNDQSQKLKEIMSDIQIRLSNITNVRATVQGGMYGAFGNNFLTRGATQIGDSITDAISSLFSEKEAQKDDPIVVALKKQTEILSRIQDGSGITAEAIEGVESEIVLLRRDFKANRDADRVEFAKQDSILENILKALSSTSKPTSTPGHQGRVQKAKLTTTVTSVKPSKPLQGATVVPDDDRGTPDKPEPKEDTTLLKKIFTILTQSNKNLEKLVKAQPMSTRDADLEEIRLKNAALRGRQGVEDIKTVDEDGKRGFDFSRIFSGMLDFDANLMGLKKVFGIVTTGMGVMFDVLKAAVSPLISLLSRFGGAIESAVEYVASKVPALLGNAGKLALGAAKVMKNVALPLAIATAVGAAADYGLGKMGVGGNEINVEQDEANWNKMSTGQKVGSSIARGIEHVGEFMFLDNLSNEAKAARIKKETEMLNQKSANIGKPNGIDSEMDLIAKAQREIEAKKKSKDAGKQAASVVQDNRVTQNQTIMPTRTITENPEAGYRRYMDRVYSTSR